MADMLVKLYDVQETRELYEKLQKKGICIKRALGLDASLVYRFIEENEFSARWVDECRVAFSFQPSTCYIAVKESRIIGFCCYDATFRDFLGPLGAKKSERSQGIGEALLRKCMLSMRESGYGYAMIGWADPKAAPMYEKRFGAVRIPGSFPGIYINMVGIEEMEE